MNSVFCLIFVQMICKEEPDAPEAEKESPNKGKKKDPNKVDKKYLFPHGITPPCKNIRKRRFRKTLKKKNVEAPEIEKEVKRLFRIDNDAVNVRYDIINEDEDEMAINQQAKDDTEDNDDTLNDDKQLNSNSNKEDINVESDAEEDLTSSVAHHGGVGEHDIFGEEVSSSGSEDHHVSSRLRDIEETSRLSGDDSRMSDFSVGGGVGLNSSKDVVTEFNKSMFSSSPKGGEGMDDGDRLKYGGSNSNLLTTSNYYDEPKRNDMDDDYSNDVPQMSSEQIVTKITELRRQHEDLKIQQAQKAQEISSIQNPTLKQRMQETLDNLLSQMLEKEMEIKTYENMIYG